jgi:hypothetical protein
MHQSISCHICLLPKNKQKGLYDGIADAKAPQTECAPDAKSLSPTLESYELSQLQGVLFSMAPSPASSSFDQYVVGAPGSFSNCQIHVNGLESYQVGACDAENCPILPDIDAASRHTRKLTVRHLPGEALPSWISPASQATYGIAMCPFVNHQCSRGRTYWVLVWYCLTDRIRV